MRLGVYVGSFNPPHKGHISLVNYLLDNNIVDKVLIIPTGNYWDKQDLVPLEHRINMLKFYESENVLVDTVNNNYPYTYQLMRKLTTDYPEDTLHLIMGADNIINFNKWKEYRELLGYNIIILNRDDIDIEKYIKNYPEGHFTILKDFRYDISSTELRENLNSQHLDKPVLQYIKKHHLY